MSRVSSRIGAVELEALAQVDHRHGAALVRHHALEELGRLGQRRGRLVAEDPLDLEDVERELLGPDPEAHELDVVAGVVMRQRSP